MIPENFENWKKCLEVNCKISLTKDFAASRLQIYTDDTNRETKKFVELYGSNHLHNVIKWYKQI
jgi:hypothetical protein|tara:strand:+ start:4822 stop:5013 length:192 start_codon:yes stop_codon:yes gene_type:complete